jgi:hypothetical protein
MGLPLPMSEKRGRRKCHDWEKLNPERVIVVNLMVCELRNATAAITPYKSAAADYQAWMKNAGTF